MINAIGFSVTFSKTKTIEFYTTLLRQMLVTGCTAIEIHTNELNKFEQHPQILKLIKKFDIIYLHYCNSDVYYHLDLAIMLNANAITIHPNAVEDWSKIEKSYYYLISIENMDCTNKFGVNISDMTNLFNQIPGSNWTCDLNHIYTIDQNMQLADEFKNACFDLNHYHISGYKNSKFNHIPLYKTKQNIIIDNIWTMKPIIIESFGVDDIMDFMHELIYIENVLMTQD